MYLTVDEYKELSTIIVDDDEIQKRLDESEYQIDILTFNRIKSIGFDKCSDWEQKIIKMVQLELTNFYYTNEDYISSYISSYDLNGVKISYKDINPNIEVISGVCIPRSTYAKLNMTRFTCLVL